MTSPSKRETRWSPERLDPRKLRLSHHSRINHDRPFPITSLPLSSLLHTLGDVVTQTSFEQLLLAGLAHKADIWRGAGLNPQGPSPPPTIRNWYIPLIVFASQVNPTCRTTAPNRDTALPVTIRKAVKPSRPFLGGRYAAVHRSRTPGTMPLLTVSPIAVLGRCGLEHCYLEHS